MLEDLDVAGVVFWPPQMIRESNIIKVSQRWFQIFIQMIMLQHISHLNITVSHCRGCWLERRIAEWGSMWLQISAGGVMGGITKHQTIRIFCRWVKNIKLNTLMRTISHPHIATPRRHWYNKEVRGLGNVGGWMWQMQLTLLRGHLDDDVKKRWWVTNMIINKWIDINSPCSRCTMSSRVLLWCVCN